MTRRKLLIIGGIVAGLFAGVFAAGMVSIYFGVRSACEDAVREHGGDCAAALMARIGSDTATVSQKNRAVWALGQLAESGSVPFLRELDASAEAAGISRHEIRKALQWCTRGNVTSWMYRNRAKWGADV